MMLRVTTEQMQEALEALKNGQVLVFPSETSYGIGCDARNEQAVERIFKIKGRDRRKALPVIIPSVERASTYIKTPPILNILAEKFWPGPLNIIAPIKKNSPISQRCSKDETQSIRVSSHPFVATLVKQFGYPIVATSANIAGKDAIYEVQRIRELFSGDNQPEVFIDGGDLPKLPASTTVKVMDDHHVKVVRQGIIDIPSEFL